MNIINANYAQKGNYSHYYHYAEPIDYKSYGEEIQNIQEIT